MGVEWKIANPVVEEPDKTRNKFRLKLNCFQDDLWRELAVISNCSHQRQGHEKDVKFEEWIQQIIVFPRSNSSTFFHHSFENKNSSNVRELI